MMRWVLILAAGAVAIMIALAVTRHGPQTEVRQVAPAAAVQAAAPAVAVAPPRKASPEPAPKAEVVPDEPTVNPVDEDAAATGMTTRAPLSPESGEEKK